MDLAEVEKLIRDVPDFPKPGIIFKDITPVLRDPAAFQAVLDFMIAKLLPLQPDIIVGVESRGFVLGAPIACQMKLPFVPVRKVGKLPSQTLREDYDLEYGASAVEIHRDAIGVGERVAMVDDLLATGGTAAAASRLVERLGGNVVAWTFMVELDFLQGREALQPREVISLFHVP